METPLKKVSYNDSKATLVEKLRALLSLPNLIQVQKDELNQIRRNNIKSYNKQGYLSVNSYINNLYNEYILKMV